MAELNMSTDVRWSLDDRDECREILCRDRFCARRSCARLLCDSALSGMAGTGASSTVSLSCSRFPEEADFLTFLLVVLLAAAKYPDRWLGAGEVGDELTDEASVKVSREACDEALDRVDTLWSESSAEWVDSDEAEDEEASLRVAMSGAL